MILGSGRTSFQKDAKGLSHLWESAFSREENFQTLKEGNSLKKKNQAREESNIRLAH